MYYAYVPLIVLATVFSMTWSKIVMQCSIMVYHGIFRLSFVFSWYTHLPKDLCVYQENTNDSWDTPWYTTWKQCITSMISIAYRSTYCSTWSLINLKLSTVFVTFSLHSSNVQSTWRILDLDWCEVIKNYTWIFAAVFQPNSDGLKHEELQ